MTALPRSGLLRAAFASLCALAVLGVPAASRPTLAQEAASAVQDVTLQDVTFMDGETRMTAPRVTVSGTRLSKDDLLAILKAEGKEPWPVRLARLQAGSISMPELRIEQSASGLRVSGTYREVVLKGVHNGRVAEVTLSGATAHSVPEAGAAPDKSSAGKDSATMSFGRLRTEDLDLAAHALFYAGADNGVTYLYPVLSVEDIVFSDEAGRRTSLARIDGRNLAFRRFSPEVTKKLTALAQSKGEDPALWAKTAGELADLIEAVSIGSLEASGLRMHVTEDDNVVELAVGRLAYGKEPGLALGDLSLTGPGARLSLATLTLSGGSLAPTVATLRRIAKSGASDVSGKPGTLPEAELRRLTPTLGTLTLAGFSLDLPREENEDDDGTVAPTDPLKKPDPAAVGSAAHVGLRDAVLTFAPPKDGVPTASRLTFSGLTLPASAVAGVPGLAGLDRYGYRDLDLDVVVDSAWDEATREVALREISLAGKDMGTLRIIGTLGGIGPEVFDPDAAVSGFAMLSATAKALDLTLVNGGLYERFIDAQSKALSLKPDELRKEYVTACLIGVPVILGNSAAAKTLGAALGKFAAKPGTLSISAKAKNGAGLGVVDFSTVATPGALLDKLDLTAKAD